MLPRKQLFVPIELAVLQWLLRYFYARQAMFLIRVALAMLAILASARGQSAIDHGACLMHERLYGGVRRVA